MVCESEINIYLRCFDSSWSQDFFKEEFRIQFYMFQEKDTYLFFLQTPFWSASEGQSVETKFGDNKDSTAFLCLFIQVFIYQI